MGAREADQRGRSGRRTAPRSAGRARRRTVRARRPADRRGPAARRGPGPGDAAACLAAPGGAPPRAERGAVVAVHHRSQPRDRRLAAPVDAGRRGGDRHAARTAPVAGRGGPGGGGVDGRGGARPAQREPPGGPGGVLLPGALGGGGGGAARRPLRHGQVPHALRAAAAADGPERDGGDGVRCDHEHDDGAYVLGALSPAERAAYERHLATCSFCREAVADIAVLPGLLGRLDPAEFAKLLDPTLTAHSSGPIRSRRPVRRRRTGVRVAASLVAAAVVALIVGIGVVFTTGAGRPEAPAVAMTPVAREVPVSAQIDLTRGPGGTKVSLTCMYH